MLSMSGQDFEPNRYFMKLMTFARCAVNIQSLSTCRRHSVGIVVCPTDFSQIFSVGYNGPAAGVDNYSCTNEVGNCGCVHAEINALLKLDQQSWPSLLLSTVKPCFNCAKAIINHGGIVGVVWLEECRHKDVEIFLNQNGIDTLDLSRPMKDVEQSYDLLLKWWMLGSRRQRASIAQRIQRSILGRRDDEWIEE